jgi:hypothetical protein
MKYFLATVMFLTTVTAQAQVPPPTHHAAQNPSQETTLMPFADFEALVEVENLEFEVRGLFTLASASDGVNFFKEEVAFAVGAYSRTIPAGSFKQEERGKLRYEELTKDGSLSIKVRLAGHNKFLIKIEAEGLKVPKGLTAADVMLRIGDDGGGRAREGSKKP